jgi:tetratricopeptide (TPR) repeat protein
MSKSGIPLAQMAGSARAKAIQEALMPHLRAAGTREVETKIGKTARFFENARHRGSLRLNDFLAACSALELDPIEFLRDAWGDQSAPEVRTPRIVGRARQRLADADAGPGIGEERLAALASALQSKPRQTRAALQREIVRATKAELPRALGLYGSCLRFESDLDRASVVLARAREMAQQLTLPRVEADLLIRMGYVGLEKNRLAEATRHAEQATVISARIDDREAEGIGFLTMGTFRYYGKDYRGSLEDLEAALRLSTDPRQLVAALQCRAHCFLALDEATHARDAIRRAREIPAQPDWIEGYLAWTEARLTRGSERLDLLAAARDAIPLQRAADRALATIELVEEALAMERRDIAAREARTLHAVVEKTHNPRVERAILQLIHHQTTLTPLFVAGIRQAVEKAHQRRLSRLIGTPH